MRYYADLKVLQKSSGARCENKSIYVMCLVYQSSSMRKS